MASAVVSAEPLVDWDAAPGLDWAAEDAAAGSQRPEVMRPDLCGVTKRLSVILPSISGILVFVLWAALVGTAAGGDQSAKETETSFEIEPEILPQNLREDAMAEKSPAPSADLDVAKLEKQLERAKRNAEGAEHLYKIGALAKAEVEARVLKVVR